MATIPLGDLLTDQRNRKLGHLNSGARQSLGSFKMSILQRLAAAQEKFAALRVEGLVEELETLASDIKQGLEDFNIH